MTQRSEEEIEKAVLAFVTERQLPQLDQATREGAADQLGLSRAEIDKAVTSLYHKNLLTTGPGEDLGLRKD